MRSVQSSEYRLPELNETVGCGGGMLTLQGVKRRKMKVNNYLPAVTDDL